MADVTQLLQAASAGNPHATADLLPLVYDQLRRLAARRLAGERNQHTLQPTALVHEAWFKISGAIGSQQKSPCAADVLRKRKKQSPTRREMDSLFETNAKHRTHIGPYEIAAK
jgi:hypothetical protein